MAPRARPDGALGVPSLNGAHPIVWDGTYAVHGAGQLTGHRSNGVSVSTEVGGAQYRRGEVFRSVHTVQRHRETIHGIRADVARVLACPGVHKAIRRRPPPPVAPFERQSRVLLVPLLAHRRGQASCCVQPRWEGAALIQHRLAAAARDGTHAQPSEQARAVGRLVAL
eukprot:4654352-Prymnesium_polylepis.1